MSIRTWKEWWRMNGSKVALAACLSLSSNAFAQNPWLPESSGYKPDWQEVQASSFIDLGIDPEALARLSHSSSVEDLPEVSSSKSLTCGPGYTKYLIRSFFIDRPVARVYETPSGLIISTGALGEPRPPAKGAIAICLKGPPGHIEGLLSFAL